MNAVFRWLGGMLLASDISAAGPAWAQTTVRHLHTDALGSVVAKTDEAGNVVERTTLEPYGAVVGSGIGCAAGKFLDEGYVSSSALAGALVKGAAAAVTKGSIHMVEYFSALQGGGS